MKETVSCLSVTLLLLTLRNVLILTRLIDTLNFT